MYICMYLYIYGSTPFELFFVLLLLVDFFHSFFYACIFVFLILSFLLMYVKLATVVEGDQKAPFQ